MVNLSESDRLELVNAIASREGTARQLSNRFGVTIEDLQSFVEENARVLELAREALGKEFEEDSEDGEPTPTDLQELWISQKIERLTRYQAVADHLYEYATSTVDPTALRELRAYMMAAANELGQLLHRGSGENAAGDSVSYEFPGVDTGKLR